jgi:hypothetical protein
MIENTDADTIETVKTSRQVGDTSVDRKTVVASQHIDTKEFQLAKLNQGLWLLIHVIGVVILLRFVFLLLGANLTGFSLFIYNLSNVFVRPFQGIFSSANARGSYFDSAALLALVVWYLFGYLLTYVIALFSKRTTSTP